MATAPRTLSSVSSPASSSRRLRVVVIDEELPYPAVTGKRIRTMGLLERLARRHQITYVCHRNANPAEVRPAADHFAALGIRTIVIDRPVPPRSGVRFYARLAANLASSLPYSVTSHTSTAMVRALEELARREPIDLWHCEWTPYAQAIRHLPGRRVVMAHNVESVIWQRYHETETNLAKRWYIRQQWKKFLRFERAVLQEADLTVAVSDLDAERFQLDLGVPRVDVVDNGVDTRFFHPLGEWREPATLLFLGSLEWRPNLDGVAALLDRIFPAVQAEEPGARLLLVGRNPPEWLQRAAASRPGVELHGNVPDVRPFLARAGMLVVPLRIGGGSRLKILEALASGTPVVSTRIGAEGLHLRADEHLTITESLDEMARAIVATIRDPEHALLRTEAGRATVLQRYDWSSLSARLEQLWLRAASISPSTLPAPGGVHA